MLNLKNNLEETIFSICDKLIQMSKDEHNKIAKVENLIWEIAQILNPDSIIEKEKIKKAKEDLQKIFEC